MGPRESVWVSAQHLGPAAPPVHSLSQGDPQKGLQAQLPSGPKWPSGERAAQTGPLLGGRGESEGGGGLGSGPDRKQKGLAGVWGSLAH